VKPKCQNKTAGQGFAKSAQIFAQTDDGRLLGGRSLLVKDPKTEWYVRAMAFLKKVDLKT